MTHFLTLRTRHSECGRNPIVGDTLSPTNLIMIDSVNTSKIIITKQTLCLTQTHETNLVR